MARFVRGMIKRARSKQRREGPKEALSFRPYGAARPSCISATAISLANVLDTFFPAVSPI